MNRRNIHEHSEAGFVINMQNKCNLGNASWFLTSFYIGPHLEIFIGPLEAEKP